MDNNLSPNLVMNNEQNNASKYGTTITNLTPSSGNSTFGGTNGNGTTAQNLTTQTWGNPVPFSDEQLRNMSGMQQMPAAGGQQMQMRHSSAQMPETLSNSIYTPGYLKTQIGKWMRVEFLIGANTTDRVGRLMEVGASYIILQSLESNSRMLCDIYSIKFVTIIDNVEMAGIYGSVYNND